ncbi:ketoacyl-ACP synthase III [candidate division TA06 bacterium]|uniref:Beta-ketoacyl-[acyl-carrier-protein] synthase III n=1 Tax=candidate division TA06 bacterium TaxID=2250710 RepID=A0A523UPL2_UNCT6|nr:MAG: ketoacyl-ACP synthase III [candidate division TA06 bacterium]
MAKKARIIGTGSALPERVLTNYDLEKMVDTSDEWIVERTGIKERRIADEKTATSDLGLLASKKAIEDAKIDLKEIEIILVGTASPDMLFPSTGCVVQSKLGLENIPAFDVSAACSGFLYGLEIARALLESGMYNTLLLLGAETLSKIVDWTDRSTCVLLADGAGACVMKSLNGERGILSTFAAANGSLGKLLYLPAGGSRNPASVETVEKRMHYIKMKGNEVFKHAVRAMVNGGQIALERAGLTAADVDLFIPHQANMRIIKAVAKRLRVPEEKVYTNIHRVGNTSAASIAICIDEANKDGRLNEGDIVLLDCFGGGLTWASAVIRW